MYQTPKLYYDPPQAMPAKGRLWPSDDDDSDDSSGKQYMFTYLQRSNIAVYIDVRGSFKSIYL